MLNLRKNYQKNLFQILQKVIGKKKVALHEPYLFGNEKKYLNDCIKNNQLTYGKFNKQFEKSVCKFTKAKYCIGVVNGTSALHLSLKLLGCNEKHEILVPALTFVGTVNAINYTGSHPHFIDSEKDFVNLDIVKLDKYLSKIAKLKKNKLYNKKTGRIIKAIIPVHTYGHPVNMDKLLILSKKFKLEIVEDAAEGLGSYFKNKHVGTFGKLGIISFNGNKIITTGGGGVILTNNKTLAVKAKHLSTTAKVIKGYELVHNQIGYNYRISNISSALGCAQMENIKKILKLKRNLFRNYNKYVKKNSFFKLIKEPKNSKSNYWLQTILVESNLIYKKNQIINFLNSAGYSVRPAWKLINEIKPYKKKPKMNLDNAKLIQKKIINIPSSPQILL